MTTASDTAYAIAHVRAQEADLPDEERLFDDPYARLFAEAGAHAREGTERFLSLPFFRDGIRLRTRHIDDVVRDAMARGTRQLVLMGAGFDARALRLPEVAGLGVRAFEVDLPAVLDRKRALLEGRGVAIPTAVHHVPCDFAGDFEAPLSHALLARGFDRSASTMFVWEGVIAYISQDAVERCLRFMASSGGPGSRLIFDFSDYSFASVTASTLVLRAGFQRFDEVGFDLLWRRHFPLRGEPHPSAQIVKLGIAAL